MDKAKEALEWYREQAMAAAKHALVVNPKALEAVITCLALDGGTLADQALATPTPVSSVSVVDEAAIERIAIEYHNFDGDSDTLSWGKQKSNYRGSVRKSVRQFIGSVERAGLQVAKDSPVSNLGGSDGLIQAAQICEHIANEPGPDIDDWDLARKATAADLATKFRNLAGNAFSEDYSGGSDQLSDEEALSATATEGE